jgi:hypothetical protein
MKRAMFVAIGVIAMGWALSPGVARASCVAPLTVADPAYLSTLDAAFLGTVVEHRDDVERFKEKGNNNHYDSKHYDTVILEVHHDAHGNLGDAVEVVVSTFGSIESGDVSSFSEGETLGVGLHLVNDHWVADNGCPSTADPDAFMDAAAKVRPATNPVVGPPSPALPDEDFRTGLALGVALGAGLVVLCVVLARRARAAAVG